MWFCPKCGKENDDVASSCVTCGYEFLSYSKTTQSPVLRILQLSFWVTLAITILLFIFTENDISSFGHFLIFLIAFIFLMSGFFISFFIIYFLYDIIFGEAAHRVLLHQRLIPFTRDEFIKYVEKGDTEVVKIFLKAGINPEVTTSNGERAIDIAIKNGRKEIIELLKKAGARESYECKKCGEKILTNTVTCPHCGTERN